MDKRFFTFLVLALAIGAFRVSRLDAPSPTATRIRHVRSIKCTESVRQAVPSSSRVTVGTGADSSLAGSAGAGVVVSDASRVSGDGIAEAR